MAKALALSPEEALSAGPPNYVVGAALSVFFNNSLPR
jgi:hypothetical protein